MAYVILLLRRFQNSPANTLPRSSSVESPGAAVLEVVKAASAIGMDRNADARMQIAKNLLMTTAFLAGESFESQ